MKTSQILWIDLQPSLYCLFKRTAQTLSQNFKVKRWSLEHDLDESCDVEVVHSLMRHTIENASNPVHLVGHGISGTIAYLFACRFVCCCWQLVTALLHPDNNMLQARSKCSA